MDENQAFDDHDHVNASDDLAYNIPQRLLNPKDFISLKHAHYAIANDKCC